MDGRAVRRLIASVISSTDRNQSNGAVSTVNDSYTSANGNWRTLRNCGHSCRKPLTCWRVNKLRWWLLWRIQDFPDKGVANSRGDAPIYCMAKYFLKIAWKWKNLDPEGGGTCPLHPHGYFCDSDRSKRWISRVRPNPTDPLPPQKSPKTL